MKALSTIVIGLAVALGSASAFGAVIWNALHVDPGTALRTWNDANGLHQSSNWTYSDWGGLEVSIGSSNHEWGAGENIRAYTSSGIAPYTGSGYTYAAVRGEVLATVPTDVGPTVPIRVQFNRVGPWPYAYLYGTGLGSGSLWLRDVTTGQTLIELQPTSAVTLPILDIPQGHQLALGVEVINDSWPAYSSFEIGARIDWAQNLARGDMQAYPVLPSGNLPAGGFGFSDQPSGSWFDPPLVSGFTYDIAPGSTFTRIAEFPSGFDPTLHVQAEGVDLGTFGSGQSLDFVSVLGHGVTQFTLDGINPLVDAQDSLGFPLKIEFSTPTASFAMVPIPEPVSLATLALGAAILATRRRKER